MSGDPLYNDSFLHVSHPDGSVSKHPIVGGIDGMYGAILGSTRRGGLSGMLHSVIRKPGGYKLQWKIGRLESGTVSFTMVE